MELSGMTGGSVSFHVLIHVFGHYHSYYSPLPGSGGYIIQEKPAYPFNDTNHSCSVIEPPDIASFVVSSSATSAAFASPA